MRNTIADEILCGYSMLVSTMLYAFAQTKDNHIQGSRAYAVSGAIYLDLYLMEDNVVRWVKSDSGYHRDIKWNGYNYIIAEGYAPIEELVRHIKGDKPFVGPKQPSTELEEFMASYVPPPPSDELIDWDF